MTARYLTCIGDARKRSTRGGSPSHLIEAGRSNGFLTDGWSVSPERIRWRRNLWNIAELLRTGDRGGYQYTKACAKRLLAQVPEEQKRGEVISTFPVFPPAQWLPGTVNFYIDATLTQLFGEYGKAPLVSARVQRDALAREREQYAAAEHICCMSRWAAASVVADYDVPAEKVHIVGGGANIDSSAAVAPGTARSDHRPLKLGFVGKDWQRKGLLFLLEVTNILERLGVPAEVHAAGFEPDSGPRHRCLVSVGFIDKQAESERFNSFLASCHFGCLFSGAEAYGLSNVEFLRLGVPVITKDIGGMADTVPAGCGHVFERDDSAARVADWLAYTAGTPDRYRQLVENVAAKPEQFTWDTVVARMQAVWNGANDYSYAQVIDAG